MAQEKNLVESKKIINKLKEIESNLTKLLSDNEKLIGEIIEYTLLLGKENPRTGYLILKGTIEQLIWDEYPDLYSNKEYKEKSKVLGVISDFCSIVKGTHILVSSTLKKAIQDEGMVAYYDYRGEIEQKIIEIFYSDVTEISENDSGIIGASQTNIDV